MDDTLPLECDAFATVAPELALGLLDGVSSEVVLAHAATCPACRALLDELIAGVDRMSLLAPEMEPPVGFESTVLTSVTGWQRVSAGRPRPVLQVVAAVAAVLLVGALGWWWVRDGSAEPVRTASLSTPAGRVVGRVVVATGRHLTVLMTIDDAERSARYHCTITLADGTTRDLGDWSPTTPTDDWVVGVADPGSPVRIVHVVEIGGGDVATAELAG